MDYDLPRGARRSLNAWQRERVPRDSSREREARAIHAAAAAAAVRLPDLLWTRAFPHGAIDDVELAVVGPVGKRLGSKPDAQVGGVGDNPRVASLGRDESRPPVLALSR